MPRVRAPVPLHHRHPAPVRPMTPPHASGSTTETDEGIMHADSRPSAVGARTAALEGIGQVEQNALERCRIFESGLRIHRRMDGGNSERGMPDKFRTIGRDTLNQPSMSVRGGLPEGFFVLDHVEGFNSSAIFVLAGRRSILPRRDGRARQCRPSRRDERGQPRGVRQAGARVGPRTQRTIQFVEC